jgi:enoyl-CoA hydratase
MSVHFESDGPVAVVTIDRPEVSNAIDGPTAAALADAFRRFDADPKLSVAVLAGANGKFCAGNDLKSMIDRNPARRIRVEPDGDAPCGVTRMRLSKPVIAAVEGYAVAGGLEVACWCDMRVAAEDAVFGVFCRRWGIPLMDGGTIRLARLIGHSHALDLILTGRGVKGEEALRMGLANRIVPRGQALTEAKALARQLADLPQAAMRSDRLSSYEQWALDMSEALANEYRHGIATLQTGQMIDGLERFSSGVWRKGGTK